MTYDDIIKTLRTAISQALTYLGDEAPLCSGCAYEWDHAIKLLRAALEQPQGEQEPVAICEYCENERPVIHAPQPVEQEPNPRWPSNASEVRAFLSGRVATERYARDDHQPDDNDTYTLSAHLSLIHI